MPDFTQGKIYVLRSHQTADIYVGSTTIALSQRIALHRNSYKEWLEGKRRYITSFELLKHPDAYIELLELWPCGCKAELEKREGHHIRSLQCVNKRVEGRTDAEYYQDNRDKILKIRAEYYQDNREKIAEQKAEKTECIHCGSMISRQWMAAHQKTFKCKSKRECLIIDLSEEV
jgi:ribosomal protein S27AE